MEKTKIFRGDGTNEPIILHIHSGSWRSGGALFREFLSRELNGRARFPAGTFTANMLAPFLTGIAVGLQNFGILPESAYPLVDVGFCATLSTFSALAWEIAEMIKSKKFMSAAIYISATFAFGMGLFLLLRKF